MPLPFLIGIGATIASAASAVVATAAGKVAIGALAGYVFVRVFEDKMVSKTDLIHEVKKTERVRELLQDRESISACIEDIIKDSECTVVRVKLVDNDELNDLGKIEIKAVKGIVESEVYEGFSWLIER